MADSGTGASSIRWRSSEQKWAKAKNEQKWAKGILNVLFGQGCEPSGKQLRNHNVVNNCKKRPASQCAGNVLPFYWCSWYFMINWTARFSCHPCILSIGRSPNFSFHAWHSNFWIFNVNFLELDRIAVSWCVVAARSFDSSNVRNLARLSELNWNQEFSSWKWCWP